MLDKTFLAAYQVNTRDTRSSASSSSRNSTCLRRNEFYIVCTGRYVPLGKHDLLPEVQAFFVQTVRILLVEMIRRGRVHSEQSIVQYGIVRLRDSNKGNQGIRIP